MAEVPDYAVPHRPIYQARMSGKAIASLVLGIVVCIPVISSLLAIVFGIGGIRATRDSNVRGRGIAIAGLTLGICGMLFWMLVGGFVAFLVIASAAPRAVVHDFAADMSAKNIPAAQSLCDPATFSTTGLDSLEKYMSPFGPLIDQSSSGVYFATGRCTISGSMRFASGTHFYQAILIKSGSDWKIWGFHIY